jgi:hypothetical protein
MFVTVVAVMCYLHGARAILPDAGECTAEEIVREEIVVDTDLDPTVTFFDCQMMGQPKLAQWKSEHHTYHTDRWRIARVRCVPGHYEIKGRA